MSFSPLQMWSRDDLRMRMAENENGPEMKQANSPHLQGVHSLRVAIESELNKEVENKKI